MTASHRAARSMLMGARGQGGFASKEYWSGLYKTAGTMTAGATLTGGTALYFLRWEALDFIVSHVDILKLYATYAFEQSLGFKKMIEWLELHVQR
jgi:hypothetical protein